MRYSAPPWATEGDHRLVVATRNSGKVVELRRLLEGYSWELLSLDDAGFVGDIDEPFDDYASNAMLKARAASAATGLPALADDSGIEVVALGGWPGTKSARWMGEGYSDAERTAGLLAAVAERCPSDPHARYIAVVALARPGVEPVVAQGHVEGTLVKATGIGGFGYDPIFFSPELGKTFGEASADEKDLVSHRGRALRKLAATHLRS